MLEKIIGWIPENNRLERIWLMAKFGFVTRYYGSFLGLFWALLIPLFQLLVFFMVFTFVFNNNTDNFLLFLFIGIIMFQLFTESATVSMGIFKTKSYLLENIQINKLDIFYSAIGATSLGFIFNFTAFAIGNFLLNDSFSWSILLFPLILANLLILILATQLIFSTISIYLKDIDNIWFVINTLLFWGSGIFFDLTKLTEKAALIKYINSIAGILKEIEIIFHDIVAFAELDQFVDTQVKYYSTGMMARLKFAIAVHADADIFLMDEFFGGVGDASFKEKSEAVFHKSLVKGRTIVHVSHSFQTIVEHCNRVLLLHQGEKVGIGTSDEIIPEYERLSKKKRT
ncbi:MAG: ABC-type polysaccharide/polyol phosphate export permease [Saprospiraceae bacterium]|jgi:ABC-type polysaccharide/polyol phosphate export permease